MFITIDKRGAFIGAGTGDFDALVAVVADGVLIGAATENGIAGVFARGRQHDAGGVVVGAFSVFGAVDGVRAFVGACSGDGDALLLVAAFVVFVDTTAEDGVTEIITGTRDRYTSLPATLRMFGGRGSL